MRISLNSSLFGFELTVLEERYDLRATTIHNAFCVFGLAIKLYRKHYSLYFRGGRREGWKLAYNCEY